MLYVKLKFQHQMVLLAFYFLGSNSGHTVIGPVKARWLLGLDFQKPEIYYSENPKVTSVYVLVEVMKKKCFVRGI